MWNIALGVLMTFLFTVLFAILGQGAVKPGRAVASAILYSLIAFIAYMAGQS